MFDYIQVDPLFIKKFNLVSFKSESNSTKN